MDRPLIDIARVFATLSLLSIGGGNAILAEMQRTVVLHGWATPRQFLDFYAIARTAPGPGMQVVTLIGWHVAGWAGALVATLALFLPASLLVFLVTTVWGRLPENRVKRAVTQGLAPVAVGLTFASVLALLPSAEHPLIASATALACAALLGFGRIHPLILIAACGGLYLGVG